MNSLEEVAGLWRGRVRLYQPLDDAILRKAKDQTLD
jgi:hypothetical protein